MNLNQMAAQAREHWKVTNPEIYRQMVEDKALVEIKKSTRLSLGYGTQAAWGKEESLIYVIFGDRL